MKSRSFNLLVILALFLSLLGSAVTFTPAFAAGRCYVNDDANGANNGTSWSNAYKSLQDAIADSCTEIWVAAGTYKPHASDPNISFNLENGVAIYGGFAGTETLLSQRNIAANASILSGDLNGNDNNNVKYNEPTRAENSSRVVVSNNTNNTAILDGFTITGGNSKGSSCFNSLCGAGMFIFVSSPILTNLSISGNTTSLSGGGLYISSGSNPTLTNVMISRNSAHNGAAGIFIDGNSTPTLANVTFSGNSAEQNGGGMYILDSSPTLISVTFSGNSATSGGGMYNNNSSPTLNNVTFSNNSVSFNGGGMDNISNSSPILTDVTFEKNSATINGGGMHNQNSSPTLTNVTFNGNSAGIGGGMDNDTSNPTLTNVTFSSNTAGMGGGMDNFSSSFTMTNVTISGNSASNGGGGMFNNNNGYNITLKNVMVVNNINGGDCYNSGTILTLASSNNLIDDNTCGLTDGDKSNKIGASYNVNLGSLANNGGFTQTHALLTGSDAIDAGANCAATDQRGVTRPQGAACDIGAYELDSTSPTVLSYTLQASYTGTGPSTFTVTFSEDVSNPAGDSDTDDVTNPNNYKIINKGANGTVDTASCASAVGGDDTLITPSGGVIYAPNTAIVNIGSALPAGSYRLFVCGTTSVVDLASNPLNGGADFTFDFTVDTTAPSVVSSVRTNANPTNAASVDFTVTFSEPVTGVDINDFTLTTSGLTGASVSAVSGSGASYTVTASTGYKPGTLRLDIPASASITDLVGNAINSLPFTSGETYTVNKNPTFADVPFDHWAWQYIESIYQAGITGGCGSNPLSYCPDQAVNRAQMAIFILKSVHGKSFIPPVATGTVFGDVPVSHWAAAWIEQFSKEGITAGCGNGNYCPDQVATTRAQMPVFLLRAIHGAGYVPPAVNGNTGFTDVPVDYWAAAWIKQLAAEAITGGCGSGLYCPSNAVTRDQMAVFLQRTFNLPLP